MEQQWFTQAFPVPQHHSANGGSIEPTHMYTPEDQIQLARAHMFEAVHHLSANLRNVANQCDNFVKIVARHHPSAAVTGLAANVSADFLALANGTLNTAAFVNAANNTAGLNATGTPGRKPLTKDEKRALRKERKLNRDPNAPKRPPSAYLLFQNEIREDMRQQFKDLAYSEVLGKISEAWKNLTDEQRKVYQDRTVENMAKWNMEKRSVQTDGDEGHETGASALQTALDIENSEDAAAVGQELLTSTDTATAGKNSRKAGAGNVKAEKRSRKH